MEVHLIKNYDEDLSLLTIPSQNTDGPILIIDNDLDFHHIIQKCYRNAQKDNELVLLPSGEKALEYMMEVLSKSHPMPHLIFLDINMPEMDGFEFLKKLKTYSEFKDIPTIVMLSNSESPNDLKRAEQLGAEGYLVKSLDIKNYVKLFNSI
ncbi:MAG: response regulator [Bdellovibrionales bacterium]|nr:response regulator [Bdellovibrionales bacterium]